MLLFLVVLAPVASADVVVDSSVARVVLVTGFNEDCFPHARACLLSWENREEVSNSTLYTNAWVGAHVNLTPVGGSASQAGGGGVEASADDVALGVPIVRLMDESLAHAYPAPLAGVAYVDPEPERLVLSARVLKLGPHPLHPDPRLEPWRQSPEYRYANASHVFLRSDVRPTEDSDEIVHNSTRGVGCTAPMRAVFPRQVDCPIDAIPWSTPSRAHGEIAPRVVIGLRVENATVGVANASSGSARAGDGRAAAASGAGGDAPSHEAFRVGPADRVDSPALPVVGAPPTDAAGPPPPATASRGAARAAVESFSASPVGPAVALAASAAALAVALGFLALLFRRRVRGEGVEALLACETRRRLLAALQGEAGLTAAALSERLGVGHNSVLYHVRLLERGGLVVVARRDGPRSFLHVYPAGQSLRGMDREAALAVTAAPARAVATALVDGGARGLTVHGLTALTGLAEHVVRYHLRRFGEAGLVVAREERTRLRFLVTPVGSLALALALARRAAPLVAPTEEPRHEGRVEGHVPG